MQAALGGFATIWIVVAVGALLAHTGVVTKKGQAFLSNLAFLVASPALLFGLVARGSLEHLFSRTLLVSVLAIAVAGGTYLVLARLVWRHDAAATVVGFLASAYTNAGNLGLPIAAHLLGDMAWMAPILLVQVAVLQPACLAVLDLGAARTAGRRLTPWRYLSLPVRNPITVGILLGLAVNVLGIDVPEVLWTPVTMIGAMAVPMMLLAFGVSLRLDPLPGAGPHLRELWTLQAIKVVLHPLVAWLLARHVFGLPPDDVFAVTVIAALPTAQNVFVIASRYGVRVPLARDTVFWSTLLTIASITAIAAVLPATG